MTNRPPDPLRDVLLLQERMNRLFEESLDARARELPPGGTWTPLADVYETNASYVLHVELPGLGPEEVEITIETDLVRLRGERRPSRSPRPEGYERMERSYGPFSREFRFPAPLDPERALAEFRDGLLRVEVPKA